MSIHNNYNFISNFKIVTEVNFLHNFFVSKVFTKIDILPDTQSLITMENYGLKFKKKRGGFVILSQSDERFKSSLFNGPIELKFYISFNDKYFLNYTDIPYKTNGLIEFFNKKDFLHPNQFVDDKCFRLSDEKLHAVVYLNFDESSGFFGEGQKKDKIQYKVLFNSRNVKLRYNIYTNSNSISKFYITDEDENFKLNDFKVRKLASGKSVYFVELNNNFQLSENYNYRHFLKKDDELFKSFLLSLSHPNVKNISFDLTSSDFYADIFINID